jgi:sigma-B regulation protein RsbU (phosphoserine phosphatase)
MNNQLRGILQNHSQVNRCVGARGETTQTSLQEATVILISRLASDLCHWLNASWASAYATVSGESFPVCAFGYPEDLRSSISQSEALLRTTSSMMLQPPSDHPVDRRTPFIIVPMTTLEGFQVNIALGRRMDGLPYTPADHQLILESIMHISNLLGCKRLACRVADEMSASLQIKGELDEARQVQRGFLNGAMKGLTGLDYDGESKPAAAVGGDFFDFLPASHGSLVLSIGDVTGKGVPAALVMAGLQASVRTLARSRDLDLCGVINELNRLLWDMSPTNMFATIFYARIEISANRLTYVNAGQEPALLIRPGSGQVWRLSSTATVLGLSLRCAYRENTIEFRPGDILVAFTDGISEACDRKEVPFGEAGVLSVIEQQPELTSSSLVDLVMRTVENYAADSDYVDDRTVSVVKFPDVRTEASDAEYALAAIA